MLKTAFESFFFKPTLANICQNVLLPFVGGMLHGILLPHINRLIAHIQGRPSSQIQPPNPLNSDQTTNSCYQLCVSSCAGLYFYPAWIVILKSIIGPPASLLFPLATFCNCIHLFLPQPPEPSSQPVSEATLSREFWSYLTVLQTEKSTGLWGGVCFYIGDGLVQLLRTDYTASLQRVGESSLESLCDSGQVFHFAKDVCSTFGQQTLVLYHRCSDLLSAL